MNYVVWAVRDRLKRAGRRAVLYRNKQGTCKASSKSAEGPVPSASLWGVPQSPNKKGVNMNDEKGTSGESQIPYM